MLSRRPLDGLVILIVDDNADWLELLEAFLAKHGALVITASTGPEAIRMVETAPPDVLLSDIGMPGMDGHSLIKKIRLLEQQRRRVDKTAVYLPAAAISAFANAEDIERSASAGFQFHIAKPVDVKELLAKVEILAGRAN